MHIKSYFIIDFVSAVRTQQFYVTQFSGTISSAQSLKTPKHFQLSEAARRKAAVGITKKIN